jgi:hypothetical protein
MVRGPCEGTGSEARCWAGTKTRLPGTEASSGKPVNWCSSALSLPVSRASHARWWELVLSNMGIAVRGVIDRT